MIKTNLNYNIIATSKLKVNTLYNFSWCESKRITDVEINRDIIEQINSEFINDIDYLNKELETTGIISK